MTVNGWLQFLIYFVVLLVCMRPLGIYMTRVFSGQYRFFGVIEKPIYRLCGVRQDEEMTWKSYTIAMLLFSFVTLLLTYFMERLQHVLPWNPQNFPSVEPWLAWNTAASFTTNTNWQNYTGEATMSYFTQMASLAYHNFFSAAVGIAVAVALVRGLARRESKTIGNFWVDTTRACLFVLLPLCIVYALTLVGQGVIQNLHPYTVAHTLEGQTQTIAQGPIACQEAIKMLGTNGGGFTNANSAHPFENPTPFSNFLEMLSIFAIGAGLTVTLGRMTGSPGHGWAVFACMAVLFAAGFTVAYWAEAHPNPTLRGVDQRTTAQQAGANMEGKETRFGIANSALFATITTDASCGAINSWHDSFTPLGGMIPLLNIELGEIIFGGVGSGLYGMIVFVVLSVFIAGLMVGRTPEYLGKKIEAYDVKMSMLYVLIFPLIILTLTALSVLSKQGLAGISNPGPHGLTQILYAFSSAAGNNGSAFAGLSGNTRYYNGLLGFTMLTGRFLMMIPMLALAGNLAGKKSIPPSPGTFPVNTPLFTVLLTGVILIVGALTFFPALSLGPILEHLLLQHGTLFS
ncbi:MAG TPA: potassium-transporting ATPase subunit KdpA [Acidobacteriaceae bacterium]